MKKKSIFKTILLMFALCVSLATEAQQSLFYSITPAPLRTTARTDNNVPMYSGSGNFVNASSIGYVEGANSAGTLVPSDTAAKFTVYSNLNALGGVSFKYKVDSIQVFIMSTYENFVDVKLVPLGGGNDTILLPAASKGKTVTIKNSTLNTIYVKGKLRSEYIDTLVTIAILKKATLNLVGTGLTAPTGTVVATNKLNPSWIVR